MKNKNIIESIVCALRGIKDGFKRERNFKFYGKVAAIFFCINLLIKASYIEYGLYVVSSFLVFITEMINSAFERLIDYAHQEVNDELKYIKDIAAGAVLLAGFMFFIVEGLVIFSHII